MVNELESCKEVKDITMNKAKKMLGVDGTTEVIVIHGVYSLLARLIRSAKVEFDPPIPGLLEILQKYNEPAILKEKHLVEKDA